MARRSLRGRSANVRGAIVGLVGGLSLVVYLLLKSQFAGEGWLVPLVPPEQSWTAYHLLETIPVGVLLVAVVALYRDRRPVASRAGRLGYAAVALGLLGVNVSHVFEHLVHVPLIPSGDGLLAMLPFGQAVTERTNLVKWCYFLSWALVGQGLLLVGVTLRPKDGADRVLRSLFVSALPFGLLLGTVAVATGTESFADGFKLADGLVWFGVGLVLLAGASVPAASERGDGPEGTGETTTESD